MYMYMHTHMKLLVGWYIRCLYGLWFCRWTSVTITSSDNGSRDLNGMSSFGHWHLWHSLWVVVRFMRSVKTISRRFCETVKPFGPIVAWTVRWKLYKDEVENCRSAWNAPLDHCRVRILLGTTKQFSLTITLFPPRCDTRRSKYVNALHLAVVTWGELCGLDLLGRKG